VAKQSLSKSPLGGSSSEEKERDKKKVGHVDSEPLGKTKNTLRRGGLGGQGNERTHRSRLFIHLENSLRSQKKEKIRKEENLGKYLKPGFFYLSPGTFWWDY